MKLTTRVLNRTTLQRQMLLQRQDLSVTDAIEHLVGLQAQATNPPYVALWSRLNGFRSDELSEMITDRRVVRTHLMRGTLHLVTPRDCLALRPLVQPVLERGLRGAYGRDLEGVDLPELAKAGRELAEEQPHTIAQLGELLRQRWPDRKAHSLGRAVPCLVPLVQVPPRGIWGRSGPAANTTAENWIGQAFGPADTPDEMIMRYLTAFGPATVADVSTWCGLTGLRERIEQLRPGLRVFSDESGRELFDAPDTPISDPDVPAPPRFLPEFDNVLLSHADRTRVMSEGHRKRWAGVGNGVFPASFMVDGFLRGTWRIVRQNTSATLMVEPYARLSEKVQVALAKEGAKLLAFAAPGKVHDLRFTPSP